MLPFGALRRSPGCAAAKVILRQLSAGFPITSLDSAREERKLEELATRLTATDRGGAAGSFRHLRQPHGADAVEITYKTSGGGLGQRVVCRS